MQIQFRKQKLLNLLWGAVGLAVLQMTVAELVCAAFCFVVVRQAVKAFPYRSVTVACVGVALALFTIDNLRVDVPDVPTARQLGYVRRTIGVLDRTLARELRVIIDRDDIRIETEPIRTQRVGDGQELQELADIVIVRSSDIPDDETSAALADFYDKGGAIIYLVTEHQKERPALERLFGIRDIVGGAEGERICSMHRSRSGPTVAGGSLADKSIKVVADDLLCFHVVPTSDGRVEPLVTADEFFVDRDHDSVFDSLSDLDTRGYLVMAGIANANGGRSIIIGCPEFLQTASSAENLRSLDALVTHLASDAPIELEGIVETETVRLNDTFRIAANVKNTGKVSLHSVTISVVLPEEVTAITWNKEKPDNLFGDVAAKQIPYIGGGTTVLNQVGGIRRVNPFATRIMSFENYEEDVYGYATARDTRIGPIRLGVVKFEQPWLIRKLGKLWPSNWVT